VNEHDEKPEALDRIFDPKLEVLGEFLDQLEEYGAMDLEELDGFFAALHCCPEMVPPGEYLPEVIGDGFENGEIFPNDDAIQMFLDLINHHWNEVGRAFTIGDFFIPLLLEDDEGKTYGNNWAIGFVRGMDMRHDAWGEIFQDDDEFAVLIPIMALVHEMDPDPEMRSYQEPVSDEMREKLLAGIAGTVTVLYARFAPQRMAKATRLAGAAKHKIGRNDPCYCGSGKKYKKCCGVLPVN
jgi:uncharacterized protein